MSADDGRGRRPGPTGGAGPALEGYDDLSLVGKGGFARVYRAWQSPFSREVAVKILSRQDVDSRAYRLFDRERSALGSLSSHPNIVTVYDSGVTVDGAPFLAMEFVPGGSLADRLAEGPMDWRDVLRIGIKLAGALETAHRAGMLHRDIKPENVLLSEFGEPQLADFGVARLQAGPQTRSLEVNLSVPFSPPELLDGAEPSVRSDVYSLACTLHSLALGRPSFLSGRERDDSIVPLMVRIHGEAPSDLRHHGVPDAVCRVLERGMAKEPSGRQPTALVLGRELQEAESMLGLPATVLPVPGAGVRSEPPPAVAPPPVRNPTLRFVPRATPAPATGNGRRKVVAVVAVAGVLAAGSALSLSRREGAEGAGGSTITASPTGAATTSPAPAADPGPAPPAPPGSPAPLPATTRAIPAGSYVLERFEPRTELRLERGWNRSRADRPYLVELERTGRPANLVSIFAVQNVVDPGRTYGSIAEARQPGSASAGPDDVVAWLGAHPYLAVDSTEAVSAAGLAGQRLDVSLRGGNAVCGPTPRTCTALFHFGSTVFVLLPEHRNRLYVFRAGGRPVVVSVEARPDVFDEVVAETERFVATMEIAQP